MPLLEPQPLAEPRLEAAPVVWVQPRVVGQQRPGEPQPAPVPAPAEIYCIANRDFYFRYELFTHGQTSAEGSHFAALGWLSLN